MKKFTPAQKRRIKPFLPKLLRRFRCVARNGRTKIPCAVCASAPKGTGIFVRNCSGCDVFGGVGGVGPCVAYIPQPPQQTNVRADSVWTRADSKSKNEAKAWGAQIVAILEKLE